MDAAKATGTRYITHKLAPGAWWKVDEVGISVDLIVYYRLAAIRAVDRPADLRDERGRTPLEAFAALPMEQMGRDLLAYRDDRRTSGSGDWDPLAAARVVTAFRNFVRRFGPVGVSWGAEFSVKNPEFDRLERKSITPRAGGDEDPVMTSPRFGRRFWTVSFWGHGPGRRAAPTVRKHDAYPDRPWLERIRLGDEGLADDLWVRLVDEQHDLLAALNLAEAVARRDWVGCREALLSLHGGQVDLELTLGGPGTVGDDLSSIVKGMQPTDGRIKPFRRRGHEIDWVRFGQIQLAWLITRQIDFAMPIVGLDPGGRTTVSWRATSLLEWVYLELMEHVTRRPDFGIAPCERCHGPILRTRRAGGTGNRWHPGCRGGRVERWRARVESPRRPIVRNHGGAGPTTYATARTTPAVR